jgi:ABC-type transport system involved in multi-copper enzyme maturation permease subunit
VKLREVFRYEVEYRLRSGSTWAYAGILFLVAIWMFLATADGAATHANAPDRVAGGTLIISIFGMLVTAAIFGDAAVRDVEVGMDPLIYTSPVGKAAFLGGRFLGAFAVNAIVMLVIPLGILVATGIASTGAETVGPFNPAAHVQPYFLFQLPNLLLVGAILFAIGMLARQVIPVYLAAIGLFIGCVVVLNYVGQIESPTLVSLIDPLGAATLMRVTELWTEAERNSRLVGVPPALAWNRLLWLGVAAAVLVSLYHRFGFAHPDGGARRTKARAFVTLPGTERSWPVSVPRVSGSFGFRTTVRQTFAVARNSLGEVAASRWWAVVLLACAGLTMLWGWNVGDTVFDTSTWPVTLLVVESALSQRNAPLIYVLIALYAGELVWRERTAGTSQIADAAPVPEHAALVGRYLALAAMLVMFLAATMVGGLLIQALQGYYHFELGLYLKVVFGMRLADCLLLAALAMTIHVIVNHKYVGHLLVVLAFASPVILEATRLVRHHLLLYGSDPGWMYSDMNGFGPYPEAFAWFKLYWAAWGLLLLMVGVLFWVRGPETAMRHRARQALARFAGPVARTAGVAIALILGLGGFIFYNTNVLNEYVPTAELGRREAEYEKRYARFAGAAQPTIVGVDLRAELHPGLPAAELRGSYHLVNRSATAIDSLHVFLDPEVELRSLSVGQPARPVLVDEEVGYRIYQAHIRRGSPAARLPEQRVRDRRGRQRLQPEPHAAALHRVSADDRAVGRRDAEALRPRATPAGAGAGRFPGAAASLGTAGRRPRARERHHRHGGGSGGHHTGRAAPELDGERAALLPLCDRNADRVRRNGILRQIRGARGPVEWPRAGRGSGRGAERRPADLPPPGASGEPGSHAPRHEGVARLLHDAFRPLSVQRAADRRDPAL